MNDTYKVIHVEEEGKNYPGLTIYTIERQPVGFKFNVNMWDNGMYSIKSLEDKPIGYSTELNNKALEAIEHYKLTKGLKKGAKEAWSNILEYVTLDPSKTYVIRNATEEDFQKFFITKQYSEIATNITKKSGAWIVRDHTATYFVTRDWSPYAGPNTYCLFNIKSKFRFDGYAYEGSDIAQAVKQWDLIDGLKDGAKEAWSDILEFKEYFTEAEAQKINYDDVTFKLKYIAWMNDLTGVVTPNKERTESTQVYCFLDSKNGTWWLKNRQPLGSSLLYQIIQKPTWYKREKAAYKRSYERALFEKKFVNETASQLIKHYELTNGLKKGAKEGWSDILESKDISNMCEIEDITQEDMYGDDIVKSWKLTRHFNHWQEVTYFISLDKDGHYQMYDEEGNDLLPDKFEKESYVNAIKQWDLINGLKKGAKEAWGDILS